jgi:hypothetical protein
MEVRRHPFDPSNLPWAISQCPFDPYLAGAKIYRVYRAGGRPAPQITLVGGNALPKIAKCILSLTCSTSSCKRNWSMYSFVHSKSRNRLGIDKAEALVYIYTNSKLLR